MSTRHALEQVGIHHPPPVPHEKKLHGKFEGDIITNFLDFAHNQLPGARVKHRIKQNWLKM